MVFSPEGYTSTMLPTKHNVYSPKLIIRNTEMRPPSQTAYTRMLLEIDTIPTSHNFLAAFSAWILLAGFLIVPGTFTSIQTSQTLQQAAKDNVIAGKILDTVKHASLLWTACGCCGVGVSGLLWLWWRWRGNYVWLINKIFM